MMQSGKRRTSPLNCTLVVRLSFGLTHSLQSLAIRENMTVSEYIRKIIQREVEKTP